MYRYRNTKHITVHRLLNTLHLLVGVQHYLFCDWMIHRGQTQRGEKKSWWTRGENISVDLYLFVLLFN